ncbi:MAG: hypothetical protein ABGX25_06455 [Nautiliaceae bacterium]
MRVILLLFLATLAFSFKMEATYKAKYGLLGTIATAKGIFEKNETSYSIKTVVTAKGLAAVLSKHLIQIYISTGKVKKGILVPQKYISIRKKGDKIYKKVFIFDHKNKKIYKIKYFNGKLENNETYPYYVKDDVLSLYFNLPNYINRKQKTYTFYALGGRKKDGRIDVDILGKCEKNLTCIKGNLYNKVFVGDKGIVYLSINPKYWVTIKGKVKNVLKIGDLKGEIDEFKIY